MRRIIDDTFMLTGIDKLVSPSKAQLLGHSGFDGRYYVVGCANLLPRSEKSRGDPMPISSRSMRDGSEYEHLSDNENTERVLRLLDSLLELPLDGGELVRIMRKHGIPCRCLGIVAQQTSAPHVRSAG